MEDKLKALQERNNNLTREECVALLKRLKKEILGPVLAPLDTKRGSSVSFTDISDGYSAVQEGFRSRCRGAKDVCDRVYREILPVSLLT